MMANSEGEENTMHTEQSRLVRQSMEATAHPDVYARRKTAALGAVLARTDVPLASAEKVVEVVLDAVETQDLVTEHHERIAEACTCPTTPRDADGNCDLIEQDDCPVHGEADAADAVWSPTSIAGAHVDAERVVGEVFQSFGTHVLGLPPDADLDEIKSALDAAPMPDSADTRLHGSATTRADEDAAQYFGPSMANLGRRREGWRGRLAHIEMLLAKARESAWNSPDEGKIDVIEAESIDQALAELRALIDEA